MINKVSDELQQEYQIAKMGQEIWFSLKNKFQIDTEWYLVICPTDYLELNICAMKSLFGFLKRKYKNKALIVSKIDIWNFVDNVGFDSSLYIVNELLTVEKMNALLKYYRLIQFFPNMVVISNELPFGNLNIVGEKGITMDDYVNHALFV